MKIGVPREIKVHEYRVGLVPASVRELVAAGHSVAVESGAGLGVGCSDDDYVASGAYRREPSLQRFIQSRAEQMRERGQPVELWK